MGQLQHSEAPGEGAPTVWHRLDRVLARLRPHRQALSLAIDGTLVALAWNFTYLFRLGFERWWNARPWYDPLVMAAVVGVYLLALRAWRVPQGLWRFSGFDEVRGLTLACLAGGAASALGVLMLRLVEVPRAVLAVHPFMALMALCGVRVAYRIVYEHARHRITGGDAEIRRAVVLGAGRAAQLLLAGIHRQGWNIVGLLDDDPAKHGARIAGVPVLGSLASLPEQVRLLAPTHVIIAIPSVRGPVRRRVFEQAAACGVPVLTVPSAEELREGRAVGSVRDIEAEDLLGREPVQLDEAGIAEALNGKVVLVTGAGGSIGSELCRQVARYGPARLVLYELSEFALYGVEQALGDAYARLPLERLIGDVRDAAHLRRTFERVRPHVVFHAAAFKHVPLMEQDNAWSALANNTVGTWNAARAAGEAGVERFVLISTDKAVNPTNVMGASKRAAEMALSALVARYPATRFMAVRFGNVLGSSGSVIPKFKEQIARGGPLTVTHPDIIRYFMTIPEAARLVLQAAAIGASGQVLVLDMGEPVRIVDLARQLIRLAGHTQDEIRIEFTGLRPGEKLYEELLADTDTTLPTAVARLRIARLRDEPEPGAVESWIEQAGAAVARDDASVRAALRRLVPEYRPAATPNAATGVGPGGSGIIPG